MLGLHLLRAVLVAGDIRIDRRNLEASDRRDRARLRLGRSGDADEAARLLLGEDDAAHVRRLALESRGVDVDDRELRVRVLRRHGRDRVAHQEADGDDEVIALLGRGREVRDVVGGALRDQRPALDAVLRLRLLQALVGERVEALVVEAADVRDHRDLHRRARGRVGRLARRRIRRRAAAGGHEGEHDRECGRSDQPALVDITCFLAPKLHSLILCFRAISRIRAGARLVRLSPGRRGQRCGRAAP